MFVIVRSINLVEQPIISVFHHLYTNDGISPVDKNHSACYDGKMRQLAVGLLL